MIWKIKKIGGLDLSQNYDAFLDDKDNPSVQPGVDLESVLTGESAPNEAGMTRRVDYLVITVIAEGSDKQAQYDELRMGFDTLLTTSQQLVGVDINNIEWYVQCRVLQHTMRSGLSKVYVEVADSVWRSMTEKAVIWSIAASGVTKEIGIGGTVDALPIFEITVNNAKLGGFVKRGWVRLYNPNSEAVLNELVDLTNAGWNTAALVSDSSKSNQINNVAGYSAAALSFDIDTPIGGGLPAGGGLCYVVSTGEQIYYSGISAGVMTIPAGGRGYGGTTVASIADNAVLNLSNVQANGNDVRAYDLGQEVDRFLYGMNGANTKVFAGPFNFQAKIEMSMSGAVAGAGSVTKIYVKNTAANKKLLEGLPNARGVIEIDSERFIYTGRDVKALSIDIAERSVRASSIASHADGAIIKWLEHDVWLYYGNATMEALVTDDNHQAAFDIATSTNASRVYTSFGDKAGLRPGAWKKGTLRSTGKESILYTGDAGDETADPITDMGMAIKSFLKNGNPQAENATLQWMFSHSGMITSVTVTGEKRRMSTSWPAIMGLRKSKDGTTYAAQFNEASPASAGSFVTITNTGLQTLSAGIKHISFLAKGAVAAILDNEADLEINAVTVVITNPITAALQTFENNYDLDCEIQNVTTGESLFLRWTMILNEILAVNTEERTVIHQDGTNAYRAKRLNMPRLEWLKLKAAATNQLKFIDAGTQGVTINVRYTERRKR